MSDQLREIFEAKFETECGIPSEKLDVYEENEKLWEEIEHIMNRKTVETLQTQIDDLNHQRSFEWFREGVRFGISLMLELFPS